MHSASLPVADGVVMPDGGLGRHQTRAARL